MTMQSRDEIVAAVKARGYFDGWTDEQLVARNVVKLVEEACEAVAESGLGDNSEHPSKNAYWFKRYAREYTRIARAFFNGGYCGKVKSEKKRAALISELHDVYVVLVVLESLLGVDIAAGALDKARGDVGRGVR